MATTAESYLVKRGSAKAPVSAHPAFPAIVALWFAALMGLGSLVLPLALLERLVWVTGIAALVPAAAPPLGLTAKVAIAVASAFAGAVIGLVLARRVARSSPLAPKARRGADDGRRCRPILAHDELGEEGLSASPDEPRLLANKRRALAMSEAPARSTYLDAAPLPGGTDADDMPSADCPPDREPLDLEGLAPFADDEGLIPALEGEAQLVPLAICPANQAARSSPKEDPMTDLQSLDPPGNVFGRSRPAQGKATNSQPLPFAAPSQRRVEPVAFDEDDYDAKAPQLSVIDHSGSAPGDDEAGDRPLADLGLIQLAARLEASLKRHKARLSAETPEPATPAAARFGAAELEAAGADEAARAIADFFSPAEAAETAILSVPASLRALSFESDDEAGDDSFAASLSLPLASPASSSEDREEPQTKADIDEGDYSSLLTMKNPFARQQEFIRVDEPEDEPGAIEPAVTFPSPVLAHPAQGHPAGLPRAFDPPRNAADPASTTPARDPTDAERNLRDALATLQRMSGAA